MVAGVLAAIIYVGFAVGPFPAITADTFVGINTIDAGASIFTWVALTVINIFTRGGPAMVFKMGAILAFIVLWTLAEIVAGTVVAWGTILAGVGLTIINVQLAEVS